MESYQKSRAYRHFVRYSPKNPFAADNYERGVYAMRKWEALQCAHMQLQPREMRASFAIDIDSPHAVERVLEMDFLPAHLIMVNPLNGHAHVNIQIGEPVTFGGNARPAPQRAFMDLQKQLRLLYGGDASFGHFMIKTPGHERWRTIYNDHPPYSMAELFEAIPVGIARQARSRAKPLEANSVGRHQTLFDIGRYWAYGEVAQAKLTGNYEAWKHHVTQQFLELNAFAIPLPLWEVRSLAGSVARYCWANADKLSGSVIGGAKRSRIPSDKRTALTPRESKSRMAQGGRYGAEITNARQRNKRDDLILDAIGSLIAEGIPQPSKRQIAQRAGVSERTVANWRSAQGGGSGN